MTRIIVHPAAGGHFAECSSCGWKSKVCPVPDTAYIKGQSHECKEQQ